jgi:xanthine/uracil/vitamin C permease (AzgA family)
VGAAVGIGMLTALAGATEIDLVVPGDGTIVSMGKITVEIMIAIAGDQSSPICSFPQPPPPPPPPPCICTMTGVIIIAAALHYHVKGAFCLALVFCSVVWWSYDDSWPQSVVRAPTSEVIDTFFGEHISDGLILSANLIFLYLLTLSGLVSSLSSLAGLVREDNSIPRNRWLFLVCGVATCLSGLMSGPPILISPESASGIKAGAKTGLSTVVCGLLFGLSVFFGPVLENVPHAATAPLLIAVGIVLFQNVQKLNWKVITESAPAYVVLFFIPFTYSILQGVAIGYVVYLILGVLTGQIFYGALDLWMFYVGVSPAVYYDRRLSMDPSTLVDPLRALSSTPSIASHYMDTRDEGVVLNLGITEDAEEIPAYFPTVASRASQEPLSANSHRPSVDR